MEQRFNCALIFGNNMILQRNKPVPIFGNGKDGLEIVVEFQNQLKSTIVVNGYWKVELDPLTTSYSEQMVIRCKEDKVVFSNISVGEVWLAGGQSNMEFFIKYDEDYDQTVLNCQNDYIRFFDYPKVSHEGALENHDYSRFGFWRLANSNNIDYFSAVGYYFALELHKKLKCPIGIVGCNWGGTRASAWTEPSYLEDNEGKIWLDEYNKAIENIDLIKHYEDYKRNPMHYNVDPFSSPLINQLMKGMTKLQSLIFFIKVGNLVRQGKLTLEPTIGPWYENRPGGLYEMMVKKIAPFAIKGVIWYQGESDDLHPEIYDVVFSKLIKCWRDLWKQELPFLFVQLAPYGNWMGTSGDKFPIIREKQEWVSKNVSNTFMASIMDIGDKVDIHPKKKEPVGTRLALLAEGKVYDFDIICEAPYCDQMFISENKLVLNFKNANFGLLLKGKSINSLEVVCDGRKLKRYKWSIESNNLIIVSKQIKPESKIDARFAYKGYCVVNLFNSMGLPVKPFTLSR